MKHINNPEFLCFECTGAGCKLCSGTGYYYGEKLAKMISLHCDTLEGIAFLASEIEDIIHEKDREICQLKKWIEIFRRQFPDKSLTDEDIDNKEFLWLIGDNTPKPEKIITEQNVDLSKEEINEALMMAKKQKIFKLRQYDCRVKLNEEITLLKQFVDKIVKSR